MKRYEFVSNFETQKEFPLCEAEIYADNLDWINDMVDSYNWLEAMSNNDSLLDNEKVYCYAAMSALDSAIESAVKFGPYQEEV